MGTRRMGNTRSQNLGARSQEILDYFDIDLILDSGYQTHLLTVVSSDLTDYHLLASEPLILVPRCFTDSQYNQSSSI